MAFPMLLLAAQAAGLAMNLWANKRANQADAMGTQMQQRELDMRMQQEQLASSQESLMGMEKLMDVMSSQRAIFAARGQTPGGSNYFIGQNSVRAFGEDENARKLSLGFKQYYTKATQNLMGLESTGRKSAAKGLNMMSFNSASGGINDLLAGFGKNWGKSGLANSSAGNSAGGSAGMFYTNAQGARKQAGKIYR
jgi:hypothetical protein